MPAQYQSQDKKQDPILDHLDEINDQLDQEEKRHDTQKKRSNLIHYIVMAALGACLGLGIYSVRQFIIDPSQTVNDYTTYDNETWVTVQDQPSYTDDQAYAMYQDAYTSPIEISGDTYTMNCTLQDFLNAGWTIDETTTILPTQLAASQTQELTLVRGDERLNSMKVTNNTDAPISIDQASMQYLCLVEDRCSYTGTYGFKAGMTEQEALDIFAKENLGYSIEKLGHNTMYSLDADCMNGSDGNYYSVNIDIFVNDGVVTDGTVYLYTNLGSQYVSLD